MKVVFWLRKDVLHMQRVGDSEIHKVSYQNETLLFRQMPEAIIKDIEHGWTLCLIIEEELYDELRGADRAG